MAYLSRDDISKVLQRVLEECPTVPTDVEHLKIAYGIIRGAVAALLYAQEEDDE